MSAIHIPVLLAVESTVRSSNIRWVFHPHLDICTLTTRASLISVAHLIVIVSHLPTLPVYVPHKSFEVNIDEVEVPGNTGTIPALNNVYVDRSVIDDVFF